MTISERRHDAYRHPGKLDRKVVDWLEQIPDQQYRKNFALSLILYWRRNPDGRIFGREKYLENSEGCRC